MRRTRFDPTLLDEEGETGDIFKTRLFAIYDRLQKIETKRSFVEEIHDKVPEEVLNYFKTFLFCDEMQEKFKGRFKKKTRMIYDDDDE